MIEAFKKFMVLRRSKNTVPLKNFWEKRDKKAKKPQLCFVRSLSKENLSWTPEKVRDPVLIKNQKSDSKENLWSKVTYSKILDHNWLIPDFEDQAEEKFW